MKPGEILNANAILESAIARYNPERAKARSIFEKGSGFIPKLKWEVSQKYSVLYPLELALPFDPRTLETTEFNYDNPFPLPGSVHTSILALRKLAADNEEFAALLAKTLNTTVEGLKVNSDTVEKNDFLLFHQIARIQYLTSYVQRLNTDESKYRFGRTIGCKPVEFDEQGNVTKTEGVGMRLFEFENARTAILIQQLTETYNPGGENENQPKDDLKEKTKKLWSERLIGNPYPMSVVQVIAFKINRNFRISDGDIDKWTKAHRPVDVSYYLKMNRKKLDLIENILCSVANDIHCDFIETLVDVPVKEKTEKDIDYMAITPAATSEVASVFGLNPQKNTPYNDDIEGFEEAYRETRDDNNQWSLDILQKSIFEFRILSDATLLSEMQNALKDLDKSFYNSSSMLEFSDITDRISGSLTTEIATAVFDNNGNDTVLDEKVVNAAPVDTQESTELFEQGSELLNFMTAVSDEDK